jgi:hypothetical protein
MSFLKGERGGSLKKRWNLVLEKWSEETLLLVSRWTRALEDLLEFFSSVWPNFGDDVTSYLLGC